MGLAGHPVAHLELRHVLPQGHHLSGPLVAQDMGELLGPLTGPVPPDDLGVAAADGHGADAAEDLVAPGGGHRYLLELQVVVGGEHHGLHGLWNGIHGILPFLLSGCVAGGDATSGVGFCVPS